jgi:hypothetical protein
MQNVSQFAQMPINNKQEYVVVRLGVEVALALSRSMHW